MNAFLKQGPFGSLASKTGSEGDPKRKAVQDKAAAKEAAKKEAAEKRRQAAEERKKEQNEKKQLMAAGRKAASLAAKTLQSLSNASKNVAEATSAPHNMDIDHPQIKSLQIDLETVETWRKGAAATLAAQAKCSGKPLPLLPYKAEKQCNNKIKAVKDQMAALKIILKPPKTKTRKRKEEQPES